MILLDKFKQELSLDYLRQKFNAELIVLLHPLPISSPWHGPPVLYTLTTINNVLQWLFAMGQLNTIPPPLVESGVNAQTSLQKEALKLGSAEGEGGKELLLKLAPMLTKLGLKSFFFESSTTLAAYRKKLADELKQHQAAIIFLDVQEETDKGPTTAIVCGHLQSGDKNYFLITLNKRYYIASDEELFQATTKF